MTNPPRIQRKKITDTQRLTWLLKETCMSVTRGWSEDIVRSRMEIDILMLGGNLPHTKRRFVKELRADLARLKAISNCRRTK